MKEILKELNVIFQTISSIPVTYDSVESMAVARSKLRKVYSELERMETIKEESNGDGNRASSDCD